MAPPTLAAIELLSACEIMSAESGGGVPGVVLRLTAVGPDGKQSVSVIGVDLDMAADIAANLAETVQAIREEGEGSAPETAH